MTNATRQVFEFSPSARQLGQSVDFVHGSDTLLHLKLSPEGDRLIVNDRRDGRWGAEVSVPLGGNGRPAPESSDSVRIELVPKEIGAVIRVEGLPEVNFDRCGNLGQAETVEVPDAILHVRKPEGRDTVARKNAAPPIRTSAPTAVKRAPARPVGEGSAWRSFVFSRAALDRGDSVDLIGSGNTLLHLKFRVREGFLVVNDRIGKDWGAELRLTVPGLVEANSAEVHIVNRLDGVEISASGGETAVFTRAGSIEGVGTFKFPSTIYMLDPSAMERGKDVLRRPAPPPPSPAVTRKELATAVRPAAAPTGRLASLLADAAGRWDVLVQGARAAHSEVARLFTGAKPPEGEGSGKAALLAGSSLLGSRVAEIERFYADLDAAVARGRGRLREVLQEKHAFKHELRTSLIEAARHDFNTAQAARQARLAEAAARVASAVTVARQRLEAEAARLHKAEAGPDWPLRTQGRVVPGLGSRDPVTAPPAVARLFDAEHYRGHFGELPANADLLQHYLRVGWLLELDPHPLFSVAYYRACHPAAARQEPFGLFLASGAAQGATPHPLLVRAPGEPAADAARPNDPLASFLAGEGHPLRPHPAFDAAGYAKRVKQSFPNAAAALLHYLGKGWLRGVSPSPLFDLDSYRALLGDQAPRDVEPYLHFVLYGAAHGLPPHALFDLEACLASATGGKGSPRDPLLHYLTVGEADGAQPNPMFDPAYYRAAGKDPLPPEMPALLHYVTEGGRSHRPTHWLFDSKYAMAQLQPAKPPAGVTPLEFFLTQGLAAFTSPSPFFDIAQYTAAAGSALAGQHPVLHFLAAMPEDFASPHPLFDRAFYAAQPRPQPPLHPNPLAEFIMGVPRHFVANPSEAFDAEYYLKKYSDVARANINPLLHYMLYGSREGRDPSGRFSTDFYRTRNNIANAVNPLIHYVQVGRELQLPARPEDVPERSGEGSVAGGAVSTLQVKVHAGERRRVPGVPTVMVVAHVVGDFLFGSERSFVDMLEGLAAIGLNVVVVLPQNKPRYTKAVAAFSSEVLVFRYGWWRDNNAVSEEVISTFEKLITERKVDCVHANTIMLREPLIAARRRGVPGVVHVRELIDNDPVLAEVIGRPAAEIVRQVRGTADWIVANSDATARCFATEGRTFTVPNTTDVDALDMPNEVDPSAVRFGLISSNLAKKGVLDFVELANAAQHVAPTARFLLIGPDSDLTTELRRQQAAGKISPHIVFAGYAESPQQAMAQVNVVVNFSHFAESFGRTVLEAMAARRPVIAYRWGALPELVTPDSTGFLVPYRQPLDALTVVTRLCHDPALVVQMGDAGRQAAVKDYAAPQYALKLGSAYRSILGIDIRHLPAVQSGQTVPSARLEASRAGATAPERVEKARAPWLARGMATRPRIAYFCWHFPVPSESFVLNELRHLVEQGEDVIVFCKGSPHKTFKPDFPIEWRAVATPGELAEQLKNTERTIAHGHFIYPTVTNFLWPACEMAGIPFTCIAHAQDIFRYENDKQNRIGEFSRSPLCRRIFVLSEFHRSYLLERGVPPEKMVINPNAVDVAHFSQAGIEDRAARSFRSVCAVHRFVEKKGLEHLIRAAPMLREHGIQVDIYGYGGLEQRYRDVIAEIGVDNVRLCGPVANREGLLDVLRRYDLFVSPCVRTADGDMDGIPTSVVEAMSAGMPVLTTDIAGLPSLVLDELTGIVVEPTPASVAEGILRYYAMPQERVEAMIDAARQRVAEQHDVARLCRVLLRVWSNKTLDLLLVTWKNVEEHAEVLRRLYEYTSLPFHVIVCANSDDPAVMSVIRKYQSEHDNLTLIHKGYNSFVGPGTNAAMDAGNSDLAIYVCGKEGFVFRPGWEIPFVHHFAENPRVGLAGTLCHSPTYLRGADYPKGVLEFAAFRNREFATDNADRLFFHVQGGFFGIRRRMYDEIGGFSEAVPHDYTDVEYSFYVESRGWQLGRVTNLMALFNKSRPPLIARVDETIGAMHPPMLGELEVFQQIASGRYSVCNVCGWHGPGFVREGSEAVCPECRSTRADRSLMRWLAPSVLLHRRLPALCIGISGKLETVWAAQFQGPRLSWDGFLTVLHEKGRLPNRASSLSIAALRGLPGDTRLAKASIAEAARVLAPGAPLVIQPDNHAGALDVPEVAAKLGTTFASLGLSPRETPLFSSHSVQFDWMRMLVLEKVQMVATA